MPEPSPDAPDPQPLQACPDCDLLYQTVELPPGAQARCPRCDALLGRAARPQEAEQALALALASLLLLLIAHLNPVFGIDVQGQQQSASLWQAAMALWDDGAWFLSVLVLVTTLLCPLAELLAMTAVLVSVRTARAGPLTARLLRSLRSVRPWVMVEVLMLGVLVALVKLSSLADVLVGPGLWSLALLMLLLAATSVRFDEAALWQQPGLAWAGAGEGNRTLV